MLTGLKCFFGRHEWRRIGSAPSELEVTPNDCCLVWKVVDGERNLVPLTQRVKGFVLLVECRHCDAERGYAEYGGDRMKRTAAYARSFIEKEKNGMLVKGD